MFVILLKFAFIKVTISLSAIMADSGLSSSPESKQGFVVGSVVTLAALALLAVGARIQSRAVGGIKFGVDDLLIIFFALVSYRVQTS